MPSRKKLTEKQTVKELRGIARSKAVMPFESNALNRAADIIEKQQAQIKALNRHRLVPVDMQPRRGTVEPDNTEVFVLDFDTLILDSTEKRRVALYFEPMGFGLFIQALLHALDFPEGDLDYVRERLEAVIYET